jgi:hypothetical protein
MRVFLLHYNIVEDNTGGGKLSLLKGVHAGDNIINPFMRAELA